jgi:ResB-like family
VFDRRRDLPIFHGTEERVSQAPTSVAPASGSASAAKREARLAAGLVVGAMVVGAVAQIWVPPGPLTLVAATGLASLVVLALAFFTRGRLRTTLAGFRFTATLLIALAVFAVIGTLVLQGKPQALYLARYGVFGPLIIGLRFDDIFHGLPFAGLTALFGAAILSSASLRLPISFRRAGFFIAHVGLLLSGAGAAASSVLSVRGRIDLLAGGDVATTARVTRGGVATGETVPLGFDIKLDQFDLVSYETEYRVGYYEKKQVRLDDGRLSSDWRLKTSFDPDTARHRLPGGDAFQLTAIYPDFTSTAVVSPTPNGPPALQAALGGELQWLTPGESITSPDGRSVLVFDVGRPGAPLGVLTAFLVSAAERTVWIHTADGELATPLSDGLQLAGGVVRFGALVPSASRVAEYGTRSTQWLNPVARLRTFVDGRTEERLVSAAQSTPTFLRPNQSALVFERRADEKKSFRSHVTVRRGDDLQRAVIAVNDPLTFAGWTLYQVNFNEENPNYSGLEAVRDPGVPFVFLGFGLICLGVGYMFYVEPKLRGGGIDRPTTPATPA